MNKAVTNVSNSNSKRRTASLLYPMMLGEVTEDERARWMRMLVVLGLAGLIIIFSPDIISFMTGLSIPANPVDNNNDGLEDTTGLPINTVRATLNLFLMLRFLGVAVAVIGGVFSAVKL
jgi:drug/metabolite transporter (DMT)-like permease